MTKGTGGRTSPGTDQSPAKADPRAERIPFPVVVFIYNRPDCAARILAAIREQPLGELYVVADGPKPTATDRKLCQQTRAVAEDIGIPCPVHRLYAEHNMGSGYRMPPAISTVLERSEAAIFLDDDCVPSASFFRFCADLLRAHAEDENIMMISGINPLGEWRSDRAEYLFSTLGHAQAWATWRRAWSHFKPGMSEWADAEARAAVAGFVDDPVQFRRRGQIYGHSIAEHNWDYQWAFQRQRRHGLCAVPSRNLVMHRGGDPRSRHITAPTVLDHLAEACDISFPLRRPPTRDPDREFDRMVFESTLGPLTLASAKVIAARLIDRGRRSQAVALLRIIGRDIDLDGEAGRLLALARGSDRRS